MLFRIQTTYNDLSDMARYRMDSLTRRNSSGNWILQFRVPERLQGQPPFGDKLTFYRSLKTKSHSEAVRKRDAFFESVGWHDDELDRQEREADKRKSGHDHYWETLSSSLSGRSRDDLVEQQDLIRDSIAEIHEDLAMERTRNPERSLSAWQSRHLEKLRARNAAIERALLELENPPHKLIDEPHSFEITFKKALEIYEKKLEERGRTKKTVARMWPAHRRFLAFNGGKDIPLRQIRKQTVFRFIEHYQRAGCAKATIKNDLSYFSGCWDYVQASGYLTDALANPFAKQSFADFSEGESREIYTHEQIVKLVKAAADDLELCVLVYVGFYSGMRLEEAFSARFGNVSGTDVFLVAEGGKGKTKAATRTVPIHTELEKALKQLGHLPKVGDRIPWATNTSDALGKRFGRVKRTVMEAEGIQDHANRYTYHSFRHGFASALNAAGFPELHIAELTGHAKGTTGKTEAGKTYIKGLPIANLVAMIKKLPTIPSPKAIDSRRLQSH